MAILRTLLRVVLIAVFTAIETAALVIWLRFVRGEPSVSVAVGIGLGVLAIGLFVEHILTDLTVNGLSLHLPFISIAVLSITETILWGVWLEAANIVEGLEGIAIAFLILTILLVPQHTLEDNILQGRGLLSNVIKLNTLSISVVEAAGASVWLALVFQPSLIGGDIRGVDAAVIGVGILALTLFLEHNLAVRGSGY